MPKLGLTRYQWLQAVLYSFIGAIFILTVLGLIMQRTTFPIWMAVILFFVCFVTEIHGFKTCNNKNI